MVIWNLKPHPYAPCMVYLTTLGWFLGQMLVNIPYMEHMGHYHKTIPVIPIAIISWSNPALFLRQHLATPEVRCRRSRAVSPQRAAVRAAVSHRPGTQPIPVSAGPQGSLGSPLAVPEDKRWVDFHGDMMLAAMESMESIWDPWNGTHGGGRGGFKSENTLKMESWVNFWMFLFIVVSENGIYLPELPCQ